MTTRDVSRAAIAAASKMDRKLEEENRVYVEVGNSPCRSVASVDRVQGTQVADQGDTFLTRRHLLIRYGVSSTTDQR